MNGRWICVKSQRTVVALDTRNSDVFVQDGRIDPMAEGATTGRISHKFYAMFGLSMNYVRDDLGMTDRGQTPNVDQINNSLMAMPNDPDMPPDLATVLKDIRDRDPVWSANF